MRSTSLVTIIPGLVSFETDMATLHCFPLSRDFSLYPRPLSPLPLHYTLQRQRLAPVTRETVRSGWYTWHADVYAYDRPFVAGRLGLQVSPDRTITCTPAFARIPFSIGGIRTAGELVFGQIAWDLFKAGYMLLRGCAWQDGKGRVQALVMPGMNGKTTLVASILGRDPDSLLIAEDLLVCKPVDAGVEIVPTAPFYKNQGRDANRNLKQHSGRICTGEKPLVAEHLFFATNSTAGQAWTAREGLDFALTNGLFFLHDPLISLRLLVEGGVSEVFDRIRSCFASLGGRILALQQYNPAELMPDHIRS